MGFRVVVHHDWLGWGVIGQKVVVEFRALKLALEGPCSARVRLWNVAIVTGGSRDAKSLGRDVGPINWRLLGKVVALDWVIPGRRAESRQLWFAFGGIVGIWERVHCKRETAVIFQNLKKFHEASDCNQKHWFVYIL